MKRIANKFYPSPVDFGQSFFFFFSFSVSSKNQKNMSVATSVIPAGALKRKRGAAAAVLDAAQKGGNPARSAMIAGLHGSKPNVRILANNHLHIPSGRSGIRHLAKVNPALHQKRMGSIHIHDVFRKYTRKHTRNGIEAHKQIYLP